MSTRPPLLEVWHWSWLDPRWTTPLAWWQAWHPDAIAVGGSDWHRPGSDAPPGSPTTWVQAEAQRSGRGAGGARGRPGRDLGRPGRTRPARVDGELVACDADGAILTGPQGPSPASAATWSTFPGDAGHHRLVDPAGATLADHELSGLLVHDVVEQRVGAVALGDVVVVVADQLQRVGVPGDHGPG